MIKKFFRWIFKKELEELETLVLKHNLVEKHLTNMLRNIDVSIDVDIHSHHHSPSWACISIQGQKSDFVKFVNLGNRDIHEIHMFLKQFDRGNVDCSPTQSPYLRFRRE